MNLAKLLWMCEVMHYQPTLSSGVVIYIVEHSIKICHIWHTKYLWMKRDVFCSAGSRRANVGSVYPSQLLCNPSLNCTDSLLKESMMINSTLNVSCDYYSHVENSYCCCWPSTDSPMSVCTPKQSLCSWVRGFARLCTSFLGRLLGEPIWMTFQCWRK